MAMTTGETSIGWQDYVAIVVRRRWFFLVPCVVIVAVTMAVGVTMPNIYRSKTILLVEDPKIMNPLMNGMAVSSPVDRRMQIVEQELLSWISLSRLSHELGLDQSAKTPLAFESVVKNLQKDIVMAANRNGLITLSYTNPNPELAQRVLNTVTNIYIQRNVDAQTAEAQTAITFIENEMEGYKKKLEDAEKSLREFKELYTMEMPVATTLNSQVISLQVQLAGLLVESTEEHPVVVQIKRQIQELTARRNEEVRRVLTQAMLKGASPEIYADLAKALEAPAAQSNAATDPKLEAAKDAYRAWVQRLDSASVSGQQPSPAPVSVPSAPTEAGSTGGLVDSNLLLSTEPLSITLGPREEQELARLRRDYQIHASSYHQMKQRLEQAQMTQRLGESNEGTKFKIIEPARLPLQPFSPNLWLMFTGSLVAGLFVGICAAFAVEYLDQSFQSSEDAQTALALPVIGSISTIVTLDDIAARRLRMRGWISVRQQFDRLKTTIFHPVWAYVDRVLLSWGL